jgi:uncharacterized NAD(P)/FAD-binding protein YdhS
VEETEFHLGPDGFVHPEETRAWRRGDLVRDVGCHIHSLSNGRDAAEILVTLHVYAPPLPELRRYALRPRGTQPAPIFTSTTDERRPVVAIVGGGFSGTMVAANLVRIASEARRNLHLLLFDRHSSFGEGPAYRTVDWQHLLNVPAGRMSAWAHLPQDFFDWARTRNPGTAPTAFLPRRLFGEYVRETFLATAAAAGNGITAEIRQEDIRAVNRAGKAWSLTTTNGATLTASAVVLATGHRPPDDPLGARWRGSRSRLVSDPWASLALTSIAPDEPVAVLGTGLTAVDVLLTLGREARVAPIIALSRRGLLPATHAAEPIPAAETTQWVNELLALPNGVSARSLLHEVRARIREVQASGGNWRAVIDGLRPHTAAIWRSLSPLEATRWLRHVRPFWEVHRHRMAPSVGEIVRRHQANGTFRVLSARVTAAEGSASGVDLGIRRRGTTASEILSVAWVINCTGPGLDARTRPEPAVHSLVENGYLQPDPLGLGVLTGSRGEAVATDGRERSDLIIVGTLRKPQLWESTAVPELRVQAAEAARALLSYLENHGGPHY